MDELGTILAETRQARGLTLDEVAGVTRIRVRYLEALEEGRYDVLPTPVHVRGFLRNYALYLDLDPGPLISRYSASRRMVEDIPLSRQLRPELDRVPPPPPQTLDDELEAQPVFFRPAGISLGTPAWFSGDVLAGVLVLLVLAVFVVWAAIRFIVPAITGVRATETPVAEVSRRAVSSSGSPVPSYTPVATLVTQEPTSPPIFSSIQLEVAVLERTWLRVVVDGETVQEGLVRGGELFAWDGEALVKLLTGNGAGVKVTLNGQELGSLGTRGEVVERIWGLSGEIPPTPSLTPTATETPTASPTSTPTPAATATAAGEETPTAAATATPAEG